MTTTRPSPTRSPIRAGLARADGFLRPRLRQTRALFRAFRRTRPFWGGLWLLLGGWLVLRLSLVTAQVVLVAGISGFGGWLTGGGMILCGLAAWTAPSQRYVVGIVGILLAISSLIISNLGGLFIGLVFGLVGGTMTLAWGPKKARRPRKLKIGLIDFAHRDAPGASLAAAGTATVRPARPHPEPRTEGSAVRPPRPGRA